VSNTGTEDEPSGATTHPVGGAGTGPRRDVEDKAYTVREAAKALHVPYRTCLEAIHAGQLGAVKVGRYFIVPVAEIDRMLAAASKAA
jgi:excisionase family DNA binding protein